MNRTILHIGPHKTGSTYLQTCFLRHKETLAARGIVMPAEWQLDDRNAKHWRLVDALRAGAGLGAATSIVTRAFAIADRTLLISAEDLCGLQTTELLRLRDLLQGSDITIVYYVRRASDMLYSCWQEDVKHGTAMIFPDYVLQHMKDPERSKFFSQDVQLAAFVEVFGPDSIKIVSYSAVRDAGLDLFTHFAGHFLGWPGAEPPSGLQTVNPARSPEDIELVRGLNTLANERGSEKATTLRGRLDQTREELSLAPIFAAMAASRLTLEIADWYPPLATLHREQRARYAPNIVPPCPGDFFFELRRRDVPYVSSDYLLRSGVSDAMLALYDRLVPKVQTPAEPRISMLLRSGWNFLHQRAANTRKQK